MTSCCLGNQGLLSWSVVQLLPLGSVMYFQFASDLKVAPHGLDRPSDLTYASVAAIAGRGAGLD